MAQRIAYHEAGHAVIAHALGATVRRARINDVPVLMRHESGRMFWQEGFVERACTLPPREELCIALAGVEAEWLLLGSSPTDAERAEGPDGEKAARLARTIAAGGTDAAQVLAVAIQRVRALVRQYAGQIRRVAEALERRAVLCGAEMFDAADDAMRQEGGQLVVRETQRSGFWFPEDWSRLERREQWR